MNVASVSGGFSKFFCSIGKVDVHLLEFASLAANVPFWLIAFTRFHTDDLYFNPRPPTKNMGRLQITPCVAKPRRQVNNLYPRIENSHNLWRLLNEVFVSGENCVTAIIGKFSDPMHIIATSISGVIYMIKAPIRA